MPLKNYKKSANFDTRIATERASEWVTESNALQWFVSVKV